MVMVMKLSRQSVIIEATSWILESLILLRSTRTSTGLIEGWLGDVWVQLKVG